MCTSKVWRIILTQDQITEILGLKDKYSWQSYLLGVVFVLVKCALTAFAVHAGLVLLGEKVGLGKVMKIVLLAEFLFLIPLLIKIVWFTFVERDFTLERIQSFYPLSLLNLGLVLPSVILAARALYTNPKVLLLDECTSSLDEGSKSFMVSTLKGLKECENKTIVLVSHDDQLLKIADKCFCFGK